MTEKIIYRTVTEYVNPYKCSDCNRELNVKVTTHKGQEFRHYCQCKYKKYHEMREERNLVRGVGAILVFGVWGLFNYINFWLWIAMLMGRILYYLVDSGSAGWLNPQVLQVVQSVIQFDKYVLNKLLEIFAQNNQIITLGINALFNPMILQGVYLIVGIRAVVKYNHEVRKQNEESERYNAEVCAYNAEVTKKEEEELNKFRKKIDELYG